MSFIKIAEKIKSNRAALVIFSMALLVRLVYIIEISYKQPFYQELYSDALVLDKWGQEIASGNILAKGLPEQDPLYGYVLGLIYYVFGHNLLIAILIQGVIGALTATLIFLIGKRVLNAKVGIIAAVLWTFHTPAIFYESLILKEGYAVFLSMLSILVLLTAQDSRLYRHWFWGGFALGLAALMRGNILFVIPFIIFWLLLKLRKEALKPVLILTLGLILAFIPPVVRNKLSMGEWVLATSRSGINFYWGNNETAWGSNISAPKFVRIHAAYELDDFRREAERLTGKKMTNSDVSSFWFNQALNYIYENPARYLMLQYKKLRLLFNQTEISDNYQYYYYSKASHIHNFIPSSFALIASFGLLGFILLFKNRDRTSLLYIFFISYTLSILIFFVVSRFRLPLTAILTVFAGYGLYWCWEKAGLRKYGDIGLALLPLSVGFLFTATDINAVTLFNKLEVKTREGFEFYKKSDYIGAETRFREALELSPSSYSAHAGLGDIYAKKRSYDEAIKEYKLALIEMPQSALINYRLGIAYVNINDLNNAIRAFETSLKLEQNQQNSHFALALIYKDLGRERESHVHWNESQRHSGENLSY